MGKNESKLRKNEIGITLTSKIKKDFNCPLSNKKFTGNMTFLQLHQHLFRCGNIHSKSGTSLNINFRNNFCFNNNDINDLSEINRGKNKLGRSFIFR